MIFIGNDIVEVSRIDILRKKYKTKFLSKVFSKDEVAIIEKKDYKLRSIHYSGKFAAKEASKKALMSAGVCNIYFKDIEILNKENGAPYIRVDKINDIQNFQISISHTNEHATAVAILDMSN